MSNAELQNEVPDASLIPVTASSGTDTGNAFMSHMSVIWVSLTFKVTPSTQVRFTPHKKNYFRCVKSTVT